MTARDPVGCGCRPPHPAPAARITDIAWCEPEPAPRHGLQAAQPALSREVSMPQMTGPVARRRDTTLGRCPAAPENTVLATHPRRGLVPGRSSGCRTVAGSWPAPWASASRHCLKSPLRCRLSSQTQLEAFLDQAGQVRALFRHARRQHSALSQPGARARSGSTAGDRQPRIVRRAATRDGWHRVSESRHRGTADARNRPSRPRFTAFDSA